MEDALEFRVINAERIDGDVVNRGGDLKTPLKPLG
jgi:hypothetical protein